jgi:hypothetical protein
MFSQLKWCENPEFVFSEPNACADPNQQVTPSSATRERGPAQAEAMHQAGASTARGSVMQGSGIDWGRERGRGGGGGGGGGEKEHRCLLIGGGREVGGGAPRQARRRHIVLSVVCGHACSRKP